MSKKRNPFAAACWWLLRRRLRQTTEAKRMTDERDWPAIVIDRVLVSLAHDCCLLKWHDRATGRVSFTHLPRTPGKRLDYDYDFWSACLCGAPVTYPEPRKTT